MKVYVYVALALVTVVLISYACALAAINAYESWINYSNPFSTALESVKYKDVGSFRSVAENLVFVLIDGVAVDTLLDLRRSSSDVDRLLSMGALYVNGLSALPSYSLTTRASILTGAPTEIHGASSNWYEGLLGVDSIVRIAQENGYTVLCTGDESFAMFFRDCVRECVSIEEGAGHGALSLAAGLELLRRYSATDRVLLWIGVADVDLVGHAVGGPTGLEYNATAINYARLTLEFVEALKREGLLDKTVLVILNDHGFKRGGHHGGPELEVRRAFVLFIGPSVKPGLYRAPFTQCDIAPTISMLMGWKIPRASIGRPLTEGFDVGGDRVATYVEASRAQGLELVRAMAERAGVELKELPSPSEAYDRLVGLKLGEGAHVRALFVLAVAIPTIFIALFALRKTKPSIRRSDVIALVIGIVAFEASYWLAYSLIQGPWSLSDISSFEEVLAKIGASATAGGLALGLAIGVAELTPYRSGLRRALSRTFTALLIVMALGLLCSIPFYVTYGPTVRFPLPDWNAALLYFASLMKVASIGLSALIPLLVANIALVLTGAYLHKRLEARRHVA